MGTQVYAVDTISPRRSLIGKTNYGLLSSRVTMKLYSRKVRFHGKHSIECLSTISEDTSVLTIIDHVPSPSILAPI